MSTNFPKSQKKVSSQKNHQKNQMRALCSQSTFRKSFTFFCQKYFEIFFFGHFFVHFLSGQNTLENRGKTQNFLGFKLFWVIYYISQKGLKDAPRKIEMICCIKAVKN